MTLRPAYALPFPELDTFLFASIGNELNGVPLSVLSALSRLDLDPREEAIRLSRLTKDLAIDQLARMIEAVAGTRWTLAEARAIAHDLIQRLPEAKLISPNNRTKPKGGFHVETFIRNNFIYVVFAVVVLLGLAYASLSLVHPHDSLPASHSDETRSSR